MTIDTLEYVKELEAAGVDRRQAEAEAHARAVRDTVAPQFATKADIDRLASATKADIDRLASATKADIDRLAAASKADIDRLAAASKADVDALGARLQAQITLLQWMLGFNLAATMAVLWKLLR